MIKIILVVSFLLTSIQTFAAPEDVFASCAHKKENQERLACYDKFAEDHKTSDTVVSPATVSTQEQTGRRGNSEESKQADTENGRYWSRAKLESDDPNFFGISGDASSKEHGGKTHFEFDISIKYPVLDWSRGKIKPKGRLLAIYNGGYDFQALTGSDIYDSKPVISKTQNPGLAIELDIAPRQKLRLGYFHHSNGQTLAEDDKVSEFGLDIPDFEAVLAEYGEYPALERISRASWYGQLRYQWMKNSDGVIDNDWSQYQFELRHIRDTDDSIFWPPVPTKQPKLQQFDGVRAVGEWMITWADFIPVLPGRALARLELQTGVDSPFKNVGGQASLGFNFKNLLGLVDSKNVVFSTYYYNGFAKDIATYHIRTKHWGIGLELR